MKTSRSMRFLTTFVAILSMLFMQHAAAAYLCPGAPPAGNGQAASMQAKMSSMSAMPDMPGCTGMDIDQSTLCHVYSHGDGARQSLDKTPGADLPPFVATIVPLLWAALDAPVLLENKPPSDAALTRSTAPPIAIRHCCLRI